MGRKKKFGEESDFVSVRVPKSKRKEYRKEIREFVENKFANQSNNKGEDVDTKPNKTRSEGFRKFEDFVNKIKTDKKREGD